ncbi:hypothetical protein Hanom_Chr04g00323561 [Helianthus anomalus]
MSPNQPPLKLNLPSLIIHPLQSHHSPTSFPQLRVNRHLLFQLHLIQLLCMLPHPLDHNNQVYNIQPCHLGKLQEFKGVVMMRDSKTLRGMKMMGTVMEIMVIKGISVMFKVNLKGWQVLVECNNNKLYHNTFDQDHKGHQCHNRFRYNKSGHNMYTNNNFKDHLSAHR